MFRFSLLLFPVPERQSPDSKSQRDEAEQMNIFSKKQLSSQCSQHAHGSQDSKTQKLPGSHTHGSSSVFRLRIQDHEDENVISICTGKSQGRTQQSLKQATDP